jgi:restriction system protein
MKMPVFVSRVEPIDLMKRLAQLTDRWSRVHVVIVPSVIGLQLLNISLRNGVEPVDVTPPPCGDRNSLVGPWIIEDRELRILFGRCWEWLAQFLHVKLERKVIQCTPQVKAKKTAVEPENLDDEPEITWKEQLLARLLQISPSGFEKLAQRLLREAGFVNVTVTGKSGDGGIDGIGVYRLSLVSFPVYFQCKRYQGSVTAGAVRDFRGAMAGRGEKGLLITTGSFTKEARSEANRDGAPPVELIDGDDLSDLLKEYGLGVAVTERVEEDVAVLPEFFAEYDQ